MKATFAVVAVLSAGATLVNGQVTTNGGSFTCAKADAAYCAGDSLTTNIIIRCSGTVGQPGNCNDNLAGVPPVGVKIFAPCWQSSSTAGDAACSFDGIVYAANGTTFPVPGTGSSSSSSSTTVYGSTSTSSSSSAVYGSVTPTTTAVSTTVYATSTNTVPVVVYTTTAASNATTASSNATVTSGPTPSVSPFVSSASAKTLSGALAALGLVIAALL